MSVAAKLKLIESSLDGIIEPSLDEIEDGAEAYEYVGGAMRLISKLPPSYVQRRRFFDNIISDLNSVVEDAEYEEDLDEEDLSATLLKLQNKADKTENLLNLIDETTPRGATDASIRFVVEAERLISSPLVYNVLVNHAVNGIDSDVRRLAWLHICKKRAENRPALSTSTARVAPAPVWDVARLRRLREDSLRNRGALGPRGNMIESAESSSMSSDLIPELLKALASPTTVERNEIALTLGAIGGEEEGVFLADALRSEIDAGGDDQDYQVYLASALSNIGGPHAVEDLLRAAEKGSERVRLVALSGLESLATDGGVALTEYAEPITIDSQEMKDAYLKLAERLRGLAGASITPVYVRRKAVELLDTILISLKSA
jgi:hypothetical protein